MPAPVWFVATQEGESLESLQRKVGALCDAAGLADVADPGDLVAVKVHFGEEGNHNYVRPPLLAPLVDRLKGRGARPSWTDTNTLYVGPRSNAVDHALLAHAHGFSIEATGIPVVIADGLTGREEHRVRVDGKHSAEVGIAAAVATARALVVVTHATGHLVSGFGGTIKNLGMGLSARKGKLYQHSVVKPAVKPKRCRGCGACLPWCPEDAIAMVADTARIEAARCIGCGECLAACPVGAVGFQWRIASGPMQERMAEQAAGVVRHLEGRIGYLTFVQDVGKDCDCLASNEEDVLVRAVGVLASRDPVALDHATLHVLEEALGRPLRDLAHDIDWSPQLRHAATLGLGQPEFQLVPVEAGA